MPESMARSLLSIRGPILRLDVQSCDMFASAQHLIPPTLIDLSFMIEASPVSLKLTLNHKHYQLVSSSKSEIQQSPPFL